MPTRASNTFALLPASAAILISGATRYIASSPARSWLASGRPKLNCGRMFLGHPAAVLLTAAARSGGDNAYLFGEAVVVAIPVGPGAQCRLSLRMSLGRHFLLRCGFASRCGWNRLN